MQCKKTLKLESQPPGNDRVLNVPDINEVQRVYTRPDNLLTISPGRLHSTVRSET